MTPGCDQKLFPEVSNFVRADRQQRQHPPHHEAGVSAHNLQQAQRRVIVGKQTT